MPSTTSARSVMLTAAVLLIAATPLLTSAQDQHPADSAVSRDRPDSSQLVELTRQMSALRADLARLTSAKSAAKPGESPAVLAVGKDGFSVRSADKAFEAKLRAYFQTDGRMRVGSKSSPLTSTFLLRRMRPILDITMWRIMDFHLMHDFADNRLYDANFDLRLDKRFSVRAGKFKPPVSLERLQSAADLSFVERGMPTNLAPSRDVGVQAFGDLMGGTISYAAGIFNGVPDLAVGDIDNGATKDAAGRIMVKPFNRTSLNALKELTVGVAGSHGVQRGTTAAPFLPAYRSPSQQAVFSYRTNGTDDGTVVAAGTHARLYPQATFYLGRFGAMAEYARSSQVVRRAATSATLSHNAWQLAGSWTLTGEKASYRGVVPANAFDPSAARWGAFELVARVGGLRIDRDAFPVFADPLKQISRETSWGTGLNWYLARSIRLLVDVDVTTFRGGSAEGNRPSEKVLMTRLQHGF
ncbi:MAG TPA: porin [Gemmatimonadaceae bacterium]|nr:porin [Gemmatimonadaceae bacterium]